MCMHKWIIPTMIADSFTALFTTIYYINTAEAIFSNTLPEIKGASYNEPCDLALHQIYIQPLYDADTKKEYVEKLIELRKYLNAKPELESKSCFEHSFEYSWEAEHYRYLECRFKTVHSTPTCQCSQTEPYLSDEYIESSGRLGCKPRPPSVGSPCNRARYERIIHKKFYKEFRANIDTAVTKRSMSMAISSFTRAFEAYRDNHYLHRDFRGACFNSSNPKWRDQNPENLECGADGRCACTNYGSHFRFTSKAGGPCKAQEYSICHLEIERSRGYTFVKVDCAEAGTTCRFVPVNMNVHDRLSDELQACLWPDAASKLNINGFCLIPALAIVLVYSLAF